MSIKRSKQRSFGSSGNAVEGDDYFAKVKVPEKTWEEWTQGVDDAVFVVYAPAKRFEKGSLLAHAKFGKGAVVNVEGAKIEVLFQEGPKKLGHGAS